jgi:sugar (pentulose or hexulose) kinase
MFGKTTVYTPVGDQQSAVLGANADEQNYVMNIGTAGQFCSISPTFVSGDFESRPFFDGKILCTVTNLPGGKIIETYEKKWADHIYEIYSDAMRKLPKRKGIIVTGGFAKQYREEIITALKRFELPYVFSEKEEALSGLNILAKKYITR